VARTRYIKPDFFDSEKVASLSFVARLLFVGLWTLADREGRLELSPRRIKARLFPYDDVDVVPLLNELIHRRMLQPYEIDGSSYGFIPGFHAHQRPHPNEAKSVLPECPVVSVFAPLVTNVTSPHDIMVQPSASTLTLTSNGDGEYKGDCDRGVRALTPRSSVASRASALGIVSPLDWHRQHGKHAWGDDFCMWVCLPESLVVEFAGRSGGGPGSPQDATVRAAIREWALGVKARWTSSGQIPGDSVFDFWRHEWRATHGSNKPSASPAFADPLAGLREAERRG